MSYVNLVHEVNCYWNIIWELIYTFNRPTCGPASPCREMDQKPLIKTLENSDNHMKYKGRKQLLDLCKV